jgi:sulfur carrier protein
MKITLNGKPMNIEADTTLAAVLRRHNVADDTAGVAVAVNDVVVPTREWATQVLLDGDTVELVRAVQGG